MTSVNVSTQSNTVTVKGNSGTAVIQSPVTTVVTASTIGPQGAAGAGFEIDTTAKIDKSVVYYNSALGHFVADEIWTTDTLVLGGNF
tara:strand:+ start:386 stop:646 length:261 start_codon:yes stop_codon:yes gene_type:complete